MLQLHWLTLQAMMDWLTLQSDLEAVAGQLIAARSALEQVETEPLDYIRMLKCNKGRVQDTLDGRIVLVGCGRMWDVMQLQLQGLTWNINCGNACSQCRAFADARPQEGT